MSCFSNSIVFSAPAATSCERQLDLRFQIEPAVPPRRAAPPRPPPPPQSAEDILEHREDVADVHVREIVLRR